METNIKLKKSDVTTFDGKRQVSCWEMTDTNDRKWRIGKLIQRVGNYEHGYDYTDLGWIGETCDCKEPKLSTERHITKLGAATEIATKYGVQQNVVLPRFENKSKMDYQTLISKIPDKIKNRYSFYCIEKLNAIHISTKTTPTTMSITIPINQIDFVKDEDNTFNIWVIEKFVLTIFKEINLINAQVF